MQRVLKFSSAKIPKLSKANLVNTKVHLLIQHINQLLRQEAFDDSVLGKGDDHFAGMCLHIFDSLTPSVNGPLTTDLDAQPTKG